MLQRVWEAAKKVPLFDEVVCAVDSQEAESLVKSFGGTSIMTAISCKSGTARIVEVVEKSGLDADIWINWQGDEPFINEEMIHNLLQSCDNNNEFIWSLKKLITKPEQIDAPNIAKVVCDAQGYALFFSRSAIPYSRDERDMDKLIERKIYFKHVGLYAYTTRALKMISQIKSSQLEDVECLEQLSWIEHHLPLRMHETQYEVRGIDTKEDLIQAEEMIKEQAL